MQIRPFATETFFARYEFAAPHMLSASDCESRTIAQLLDMAGESLESLARVPLHYTESQGGLAVREAIVATLADGARQPRPEEVVFLNAPQEGIYLAMCALLEPSDRVVVMSPGYDSLFQVAEHVGCTVERWPLRQREHAWEVDLEALDALLERAPTRMVVCNLPHNPTGHLPTPEVWREVVERVAAHGALLFSDEMYRCLELSGRAPLPSAATMNQPHHITLAGLSKSHGLPGLRSGWLVIQDEALRARVLDWKHYTSICAPAPSEWLTGVALSVNAALWREARAIIERNVDHVEAFLTRHPAWRWIPPAAGSTALLWTPWEDAEPECHRLGQEAGVVVLPAKYLGAPASCIRLGLGRAGFGEALDRFEAALGEG